MKLPHPWWHWFFMKWIETNNFYNSFGSRSSTFTTYYCSKCNCKYTIRYNEVGHKLDFQRSEVGE